MGRYLNEIFRVDSEIRRICKIQISKLFIKSKRSWLKKKFERNKIESTFELKKERNERTRFFTIIEIFGKREGTRARSSLARACSFLCPRVRFEEWMTEREERGEIRDRAGRHEGSTSCGRKERKGGEGSELSFSAPEADTFADTRHDHPLGVLRIFQWKFCVKGTPPRADTNIAFRSPLLLRFSMRNLPDLKQYPVRNAIYSNFLSPASCPLFFSNVLFQLYFLSFFSLLQSTSQNYWIWNEIARVQVILYEFC